MTSKGFELFDTDRVVRLRASGSYSFVLLNDGEKIMTTKTLKYFEEKLKANNFIRINRQDLVNFNYVKQLLPGRYPILILKSGEQLQVSDRKSKIVKQIFKT